MKLRRGQVTKWDPPPWVFSPVDSFALAIHLATNAARNEGLRRAVVERRGKWCILLASETERIAEVRRMAAYERRVGIS